ncbi:MAG TPA: hypothetical protein VFB60_04465 [Ktedonobacteraceae bacterium]|nr:hypothetical protein [Ktedonobacteraceae bacterium]
MSFPQRHYQQQQPPTGKEKVTRLLTAGLPDRTVHHVPGVMTLLGTGGVLGGIAANGWQMYTTVSALYQMFTGKATPPLDFSNITFDICVFIAFSFQLALLFLVFRIDTRWKRQQTGTPGKSTRRRGRAGTGYGFAAIEVVQHLGLFAVWVGLAFVVDTLGDYSFIASRTTYADPPSSAFLIFLYAVALYALSTLAFVRSIEYLWAAAAVKEQWEERREERRMAQRGPVKY